MNMKKAFIVTITLVSSLTAVAQTKPEVKKGHLPQNLN